MLYPTELQALEWLSMSVFTNKKSLFGFKRWSEWRDSNPRPSGPKPDALPSCATLRSFGDDQLFMYQLVVVVRIIQLRPKSVNN